MSSQPLMQTGEPEAEQVDRKTKMKKVCRSCAIITAGILGVLFILSWIVQGIIYWYATLGCSPKHFHNYEFPGGGTSNLGGPAYNLLPRISLSTENPPGWFGKSFAVLPSNEASTAAGAPVGTWWRVPGPWFNSYTYEDVANSQVTVYMRENLLSIGMSHRICRCDGQGPTITFTEGSNWFMNRIRTFFKFNQAISFKVYVDNDLVGVAEETAQGFPSVTFRNQHTGDEVASSVLISRHFHGLYDQWLVKNNFNKSIFPFFATSGASLLFAFNMALNHPAAQSSVPTFLGAQVFNASLASTPLINLPNMTSATALHTDKKQDSKVPTQLDASEVSAVSREHRAPVVPSSDSAKTMPDLIKQKRQTLSVESAKVAEPVQQEGSSSKTEVKLSVASSNHTAGHVQNEEHLV